MLCCTVNGLDILHFGPEVNLCLLLSQEWGELPLSFLLLPLFCIMFIHPILFSSHATFSALSRPKPFTVCCILLSQRGRKTLLFFCNSAKSIFWGRAVLAMCAGSSGWVGSLALHWYFICPTTSRNATCTKQCHSFKYFHSYHLSIVSLQGDTSKLKKPAVDLDLRFCAILLG